MAWYAAPLVGQHDRQEDVRHWRRWSHKQWEGFGIDYFLPQSTDEGGCYNITCAFIAILFLAKRLLNIELDSRYGDIMDLCLYNNVMTAMSLDGKALTYINQLGSSEADKSGREDWFWCACCPPNHNRLFGSLREYLWHFGQQNKGAYIDIHLYTSAKVAFAADEGPIELEQSSNWPRDGTISFTLTNPNQIPTTIRLRIPAWANTTFTLNPPFPSSTKSTPVERGYFTLSPEDLASNPEPTLTISGFEPQWIEPHPYTSSTTIFLARGPVIYCAEDAHNPWEQPISRTSWSSRGRLLLRKRARGSRRGKRILRFGQRRGRGAWVVGRGGEARRGEAI